MLTCLSTQRLNSAIIYDRDFSYQYFGFKTLERSYLLKINSKGIVLITSMNMNLTCLTFSVAERPQHMLMRVAVGIHGEEIDKAIEVL